MAKKTLEASVENLDQCVSALQLLAESVLSLHNKFDKRFPEQ